MAEPVTVPRLQTPVLSTAYFDCRNVSCKKLGSCEEACYKLLQCGQRKERWRQ
ncbi:hypothetical protein VK792_04705 [Mesobacterium sp. TK19101]|uniref:Uncharacterized protein n=1 Tax=Mesobacterium hydrothermale TaxID=3111907 RepID=A0ABU6HFS7_9RHOB|nr:hypothetical protein [Mesobacterium sp. TK19101]MEC3860574.1 hypothetical protein [Mesobacterium sp. TK19101]